MCVTAEDCLQKTFILLLYKVIVDYEQSFSLSFVRRAEQKEMYWRRKDDFSFSLAISFSLARRTKRNKVDNQSTHESSN